MTDNLGIKLINVNLPLRFASLKKALIRNLGEQATCDQIVKISENELLELPYFGEFPYFGENKLFDFNELKKYLITTYNADSAHKEIQSLHENWPQKDKLQDISINFCALNDAEKKVVKNLSIDINTPLAHFNISHIIYSCSEEFNKKTTSGITYENILTKLKQKVHAELNNYIEKSEHEIKELPTNSSLLYHSRYTNFNTIKLSNVVIPSQFESLKKSLIRNFGEQATCDQIVKISDNELLELSYFGKTKLLELNNLKDYLIATYNVDSAHKETQSLHESWPQKDKLQDISINFGALSDTEKKVVKNLSITINIPLPHINVSHIIYNCSEEFKKKTTSGATYENILIKLKQKIYHELNKYIDKTEHEIKKSSTNSSLLYYSGYLKYNTNELSDTINNRLTFFIKNLEKREQYILNSRFGIDGEPEKTLEEIAQSFPQIITRERIRQLHNIILIKLLSSLSITPSNILENIKENLKYNIDSIYPSLFKRFNSKKGLIKFIELICQANKGEIDALITPPINKYCISNIAEYCLAPFTHDQLILQISNTFGYGNQQSNNAIHRLISENILSKDVEGFYPANLSKPAAVAQAALHFPSGASFRCIQELVNKQGFCNSNLPLDRLDHGISGAVDNGLIYLSAHGTYRHVNFLSISEDDIDSTLSQTKDKLQHLEQSGIKSANLKIDIYENCNFNLDYFTIRHIIREYGLESNIYFSGKSGADTVSLNKSFSLKSQKEAIIQLFSQQPGARTTNDISALIRSSSVDHASFYINELVNEGRLVRINNTHYDRPESAFISAPINLIIEYTEIMLSKANRPIEVGIVMEDCNRRIHLLHPKVWYLSLIKYHSKMHNKNWYFYHNTLSINPIGNLTVQKCVIEALEKKLPRQEIRNYVLERILVTDTALDIAIHNIYRTTNNELDLASAYKALSSSNSSVRLRGWKNIIY